jgi:hypothetical protein
MSPEEEIKPKVDTTIPQTARIWNYWLGGKDNYAVDREVGDQIEAAFPQIVEQARAARGFLVRAVRYLAGEAGIRQFLDVGTGLPTANNTHEVAQRVAPESRIVYVDFDPIVLAHARALLTSSPEGVTDYIDADIRNTETILREASRTLDLAKPTALILSGILAHIQDYDEACVLTNRLMAALPSGSYLVISDSTDTSEAVIEAARIWNESANPQYHLRSTEQIAGYFAGLEFVEPGLVLTPEWRPDPDTAVPQAEIAGLGGVARKS